MWGCGVGWRETGRGREARVESMCVDGWVGGRGGVYVDAGDAHYNNYYICADVFTG